MRLKHVKDADIIVRNSKYVVNNPTNHFGKWSELFGNNNPIYIEIGTGRGKFIVGNALENPNINYIGIEKYDSALVTCVNKLNDIELNNLKLICMDASNINTVFDHEIDRIYLTFSDPWPKKRHTKRRLTSENFLKLYDTLFKDKCTIELKTDNDDFFDYSLVSLEEYGYTIKSSDNNFNDTIKTEYEEKYTNIGKNINHLIAQK